MTTPPRSLKDWQGDRRSTEKLTRSTEQLTRSPELLTRSTELLTRKEELLTSGAHYELRVSPSQLERMGRLVRQQPQQQQDEDVVRTLLNLQDQTDSLGKLYRYQQHNNNNNKVRSKK